MTAPDTTDPGESLATLLSREVQAASELLRLLRDEHDALQGSDPSALQSAVDHKLHGMEQLERLSRQRAAIRSRGATQPEPAIAGLEQELVRLAGDCHRQNQANGRLLEVRRRHVEQVLGILGGAPVDTVGYGPGGETVRSGPPHSLAKA